jgi:tetratricopeptide (TPR) repeat protein
MKLKRNAQQFVVLISSGILFVLLYFANKKAPSVLNGSSKVATTAKVVRPIAFTQYIDSVTETLDAPSIALLKLSAATSTDSIIKFWDKLGKPEIAAQYVIEKAGKANTVESWMKAGERNFYAVPFSKTENIAMALYNQAIMCFEKVLEKEPNNITAKIKLASCMVEGSNDPMKGITLLREVEKTDSNNLDLQLNFAFFSVKSRQFDKAIERFKKVLKINPNYVQAYLHLADVYEQKGDKMKTIESLQQYVALISDPVAKEEINKYINQLKNK